MQLASRLMASGTSPSAGIRKEELKARVREALSQLPPEDREVLVLRYLEQLSGDEIAAVLGIAQRTLRWRHRRAVQRLGKLLADPSE
jgi:RNA polymerase sigma-70 factor (ECF subfamily)